MLSWMWSLHEQLLFISCILMRTVLCKSEWQQSLSKSKSVCTCVLIVQHLSNSPLYKQGMIRGLLHAAVSQFLSLQWTYPGSSRTGWRALCSFLTLGYRIHTTSVHSISVYIACSLIPGQLYLRRSLFGAHIVVSGKSLLKDAWKIIIERRPRCRWSGVLCCPLVAVDKTYLAAQVLFLNYLVCGFGKNVCSFRLWETWKMTKYDPSDHIRKLRFLIQIKI